MIGEPDPAADRATRADELLRRGLAERVDLAVGARLELDPPASQSAKDQRTSATREPGRIAAPFSPQRRPCRQSVAWTSQSE